MLSLIYGDDSQTLRVEFAAAESAATVALYKEDGTALLAADDATIWAADTLDAAASAGDETITLASDVAALAEGDRLLIAAGDAGPSEEVEVVSHDTTTEVVTLRQPLLYDHAAGDAVSALWATYDLDASDTDTYTLGLVVVARWALATADTEVTQSYQVVARGPEVGALESEFRAIYPGTWELVASRWASVVEIATRRLRADVRALGTDPGRWVDGEPYRDLLIEHVRLVAIADGGERWAAERAEARAEYDRRLAAARAVWADLDQDGVLDEDEELSDPWHGISIAAVRGS